jgi:hypothetical protein
MNPKIQKKMMPKVGKYQLSEISANEFFDKLVNAHNTGQLDSYIGYPQNADFIYKMCGIRPSINRNVTKLEDGDTLLIIKLAYRPKIKGARVDENSFCYYEATYEATYARD